MAALRKELPFYNTALGASQDSLVVAPPFTFPGVTARVFPLRANMNILRTFCNQYLNVARDVCDFQPYVPYVLLVVLDYGRMAIEQANLGWVSQHEVFFAVPLGMWRRSRRGHRVFDKWVLNTPFIVVDNPTSLTTGRETYGWPKVLAKLQYSPESWLDDPQNPIRFLTLDVMGPDSNRSSVRLLDIDQQVGQNPSLFPPDPRLIDPFDRLSHLSRVSWSIGFNLAELFVGSPFAGYELQSARERREVLFDSLFQLSGFSRKPGLDVVTLKQFRDASDPTHICYQALVQSRLSVARYNRGGPLGVLNLLRGDITGGFNIRIFPDPAFPIVQSLGLQLTDQRTHPGDGAANLRPIFPFWMSVDLNYGRGQTICWRTRREPWYVKSAPVNRPASKRATLYNNVAGGAEQVWYGPYFMPEASFDVYPLQADRGKLERFLNGYLNAEKQLSFELAPDEDGVYVYMVASSNRMFSMARSDASIESRQVSFYVPLLLRARGVSRWVLATPFAFIDNPPLAVTLREVQGVPAIDATIVVPSQPLGRKEALLAVHTDVFAALGAGLPLKDRPLLRVLRGAKDPEPPPAGWDFHHRVFPRRTLDRLMLKQFRDADAPNRACYQALILEPWTVQESSPPRLFRRGRQILIYRYPSLPLVETLGLCSRILPPQEPQGAIADVLEARHPFRIRMKLEIGLGKELSQTAGLLQSVPSQPFKP